MTKRPLRKRAKYSLIYYFVRLLIFVSNLIPRRLWLWFCGLLGRIAYSFATETREQITLHLGLAYSKEKSLKEILALSKETFKMLGKNAGDVLRA
ncbi:MAG TPA: lipid A biosynthesis lauroyl acyltransferase, partial [Cytophagales bacterium]|nr:lipid A biosynthesis lauroyl acyltransferase [Cytophagales bacterium]